ncbi:CCA tRNA nucleotidyltransferase, mitochondrial [Arthrobotrys conoides]|uniref:CCA tRNA nucleotidyltransferase, mitochondrial n=1 Tax=Arthrobotrys conoides TaxID=74498 RepID=A0AAN8NQ80_9PEZI
MIRPHILNRRLRQSLLQRPSSSESPHHTHGRQSCAFVAINRHISTFQQRPYSRSISHSRRRALLLTLSSPATITSSIHRSRFFTTWLRDWFSKFTMSKESLPTITLTPDEEKVRTLLVDVATSIDSKNPTTTPTVLRITGGWVRDKLLNGKSHDIDIGINNMTGFEFASHLNEFLTENIEKYNIPAKSIHKIESNPEKSKHLETATTKILGLDIDFVNLRSESYSEESRIPKMEFGTPQEDALRRDACINALFYNLMTQQVEDFTERGLSDLKDRILRTPLPPLQTFKDDPLRVLRLIRFASRLSFTIDPKAAEAMQLDEIKSALKQKISRERVGVEVEKMLYGERPYEALDLIEKLGLGDAILEVPELGAEELGEVRGGDFRKGIETVKWFLGEFKGVEGYKAVQGLSSSERDEYLLWVFAATMPWIKVFVPEKKKGKVNVGVVAARDGLKMSNKDSESLGRMAQGLDGVKDIVRNPSGLTRSGLGKYLRAMGSEWRIQVLASLLVELVEVRGEGVEFGSDEDLKIIDGYESFLKRIYDEDLGEVWDLKYLLTGNEVKAALNQKAGRWMKPALEQVMEWQLDNPTATKEDALENITKIVTVSFDG